MVDKADQQPKQQAQNQAQNQGGAQDAYEEELESWTLHVGLAMSNGNGFNDTDFVASEQLTIDGVEYSVSQRKWKANGEPCLWVKYFAGMDHNFGAFDGRTGDLTASFGFSNKQLFDIWRGLEQDRARFFNKV